MLAAAASHAIQQGILRKRRLRARQREDRRQQPGLHAQRDVLADGVHFCETLDLVQFLRRQRLLQGALLRQDRGHVAWRQHFHHEGLRLLQRLAKLR